ncbi:MAG: ribonuclease HII [Candidatus Niyogibacteria bacterium]|nr:ribonuclease HII [Candidatus Niyogibacteria bacterium]
MFGKNVGVDEAGRGPLAGPITLAYVICPRKNISGFFRGIKDSKRLTAKARGEWFKKIKNHPEIYYGVTSVGESIIDRLGLSKAINLGIARLLRRSPLGTSNNFKILLDGGLKAPEAYPQKTIIKGDEKIPVIAAASVMAKVSRDKKMTRLSRKFPQYGFEIHKGYGTRLHYQMLKKYGFCEIHRISFLSNFL